MVLRALKSNQYISKGLVIVEKETWITTSEAAEIMNVAEETVRRLCRDGNKINCRKWHQSWQVERASAEAYIKSEGGRPRLED